VTSAWGFAAVVAVVLGSVARELVRLRRLAVRHEAIARLTVQAAPGTVIQDSDQDGTATRIFVGYPGGAGPAV